MTQLDYFIVLVAALVGASGWPWSQRIAWGIVGVLAIAKLLKVE